LFSKVFKKKFKEKEIEEERLRALARKAEIDKLRDTYNSLMEQRAREREADANWRKSLGIKEETAEDFYVVEECVEEILDEKIEVIES